MTTTTSGAFATQRADTTDRASADWASAWPDLLAFVIALGMAWRGRWAATDLVWSLWLSSLVVGYAIIVWSIVRPAVTFGLGMWRSRAELPRGPALVVVPAVLVLGALFVLAFFTVHFGGFHYVHSQFLASMFPVTGSKASFGSADRAMYLEVLHRYWRFLPAAFLAERGAFLTKTAWAPAALTALRPGADREAALRERLGEKKSGKRMPGGDMMGAPYRNVIRMHLLIFFFVFAHFAKLENFVVYAVVYATYFFPWRLLRRRAATESA